MTNVHSIDPYKVARIETLGMDNDAEAKRTLEQVAKQVQPILRRRKFTVPLLEEFFPRQTNLLGMNVGGGGGSTAKIMLRLRPASSSKTFLPFESVLGTMLHEITHNVHSPHAGPFYKLLDELKAECEELMAKGVSGTGEGFDAPAAGKVGGRFVGRELSAHDRRDAALKAAELRARRQAIMPNGPQRLGGDTSLRDLPPAAAAAAAAERRARDNRWCPTEWLGEEQEAGHSVHDALQAVLDGRFTPGKHDRGVEKQQQQREEDGSRKRAGEMQQQDGSKRKGVSAPTAGAGPSRPPQKDYSKGGGGIDLSGDVVDLTCDENAVLLPSVGGAAVEQPGEKTGGAWTCAACTYLNSKAIALQCEVCLTMRR